MLEIKALSLQFGGLKVLRDVSLTAKTGEVTALIGPNGAGKSALLNCISGFYPASPHSIIKVGDTSLEKMPSNERSRLGVSRTFQHLNLVRDLTVEENVMSGLTPVLNDGLVSALTRPFRYKQRESQRRNLARKALKTFGLEAYRDICTGTLPLGIQRRCDLARAMMCEPKVLLLDEPASGMSRIERQQIPVWIQEFQNESTCAVVWIEHDIDLLVSSSDAVFVLHHGEVMTSGRPKQVPEDRSRVIDAYFGRKIESGV